MDKASSIIQRGTMETPQSGSKLILWQSMIVLADAQRYSLVFHERSDEIDMSPMESAKVKLECEDALQLRRCILTYPQNSFYYILR